MIVDTSVILAILFEEPQAQWVAQQLNSNAGQLCMSTVNLAETLILLRDRQPTLYDELEEDLLTSGIRFVPPDISQSKIAAQARLRYPLNLGDCFVYALSVAEDRPILTLDQDFRVTDRPVILPVG